MVLLGFHGSPTLTREQQEFIGVLILAYKTRLWFIGAAVWHHLHHGFATDKLLKNEPALCRTPCRVHVRMFSVCHP